MSLQLKGKKVLVLGLARSGMAVARFAVGRGATVIANDIKAESALTAETGELRQLGVEVHVGSHPAELFTGSDLIVISPGIRSELDQLQQARQAGVKVIGEAEFAYSFLRGRLIGITGSNGKTTTTSLIGHLMRAAGAAVQVGGNIGVPLTSLIDESTADGWTVAELSSFQLENIDTLRPAVSVVTNITPDHLDRYASFQDYVRAKQKIFANQQADDWAVLNGDDSVVAETTADARIEAARRPEGGGFPGAVYFSSTGKPVGAPASVWLQDGVVVCNIGSRHSGPREIIPAADIPLVGIHNVENVMAAVAAVMCALGPESIAAETLRDAIKGFQGVEHRIEFVAEIGGVKFYNDSKATNIDSTIKALQAFNGNLILILGGRDKGSDYTSLSALLREKVKRIVLIGEASDKIDAQLSGVRPIVRAGSMSDALQKALEDSVGGDTVLLSPACSSFDMFDNYEQRGRVFKSEVRKLMERAGAEDEPVLSESRQ
jgi:UDP-N-acetylmuramoylalanine--D-glutamate ligase